MNSQEVVPKVAIFDGPAARAGCDEILRKRGILVQDYSLTVNVGGGRWRLHGLTSTGDVFVSLIEFNRGWQLVSLVVRIR